jgi:hypothetical protein
MRRLALLTIMHDSNKVIGHDVLYNKTIIETKHTQSSRDHLKSVDIPEFMKDWRNGKHARKTV